MLILRFSRQRYCNVVNGQESTFALEDDIDVVGEESSKSKEASAMVRFA